jgi:hypothetical protein
MSAEKSFAAFLSDNSRDRAPIGWAEDLPDTPHFPRRPHRGGMTTGMIERRGTAPLIWRSLNWSDRMTFRRREVSRSALRLLKAV